MPSQPIRFGEHALMAKESRPVRFAKQVLRAAGVEFFKRPNLTSPGRKPWAFVLTRYLESTIICVGRFVWLLGSLGQRPKFTRLWPYRTSWQTLKPQPVDRFVLSSFLNAVLPDESWVTLPTASSHLQDADYLVLGTGSQLIDGTSLLAHNYFHFLLQAVPVWLLLDADQALLLKVQGVKHWHESACAELDIPLRREVAEQSPSSKVVRRKGLYPTQMAVSSLRKRVQETVGVTIDLESRSEIEPHRHPRILFVNRTPSNSAHMDRMISNLGDVEKALRAVGEVKIEDLGGKSFPEQISLVNWADVLCGPHGAGLSNLALHLRSNALGVVELVHHQNVRWHFERLSYILGFDFRRVFVSETTDRQMVIDTVELAGTIREITWPSRKANKVASADE